MSEEPISIITSLIDYCNSFLTGLSNCAPDSLDGLECSTGIFNSHKLVEMHFIDAQFAVRWLSKPYVVLWRFCHC